MDCDAGTDSVDAKDLTETVSSVRPPWAAMAGIAGRGPGTLESEVEVIAKEPGVSSDDPGGEKPVPAMFALAVGTRKGNPSAPNRQFEFVFSVSFVNSCGGGSQEYYNNLSQYLHQHTQGCTNSRY